MRSLPLWVPPRAGVPGPASARLSGRRGLTRVGPSGPLGSCRRAPSHRVVPPVVPARGRVPAEHVGLAAWGEAPQAVARDQVEGDVADLDRAAVAAPVEAELQLAPHPGHPG